MLATHSDPNLQMSHTKFEHSPCIPLLHAYHASTQSLAPSAMACTVKEPTYSFLNAPHFSFHVHARCTIAMSALHTWSLHPLSLLASAGWLQLAVRSSSFPILA
jgi:hypothetical protein